MAKFELSMKNSRGRGKANENKVCGHYTNEILYELNLKLLNGFMNLFLYYYHYVCAFKTRMEKLSNQKTCLVFTFIQIRSSQMLCFPSMSYFQNPGLRDCIPPLSTLTVAEANLFQLYSKRCNTRLLGNHCEYLEEFPLHSYGPRTRAALARSTLRLGVQQINRQSYRFSLCAQIEIFPTISDLFSPSSERDT